MVRCYADDTAAVFRDLWVDFPPVAALFEDWREVSGLSLNIQKPALVPLFLDKLEDVRRHLQDALPEWARMELASHAKYLGYQLGPGRDSAPWAPALETFRRRASIWGTPRGGAL